MGWKDIVSSVAPYLGAAVGGPLGGVAITAIANALGLSEKTEGAIKDALAGVTPEHLLTLKVAEQEFAFKMQELGFANDKDMEALATADRDSARRRETIVLDSTPRNLAYLITFGFFGVLVFIMLGEVQEGMRAVLYTMLGALGASWQATISYYFGSTKGSAAKTELLARAEPIK